MSGTERATRFAANSAILGISYAFNTVLSAVVAIFLVQHLGRDEYGVLTTIYSYLSFFLILTSVGVDTIVQREVAKAPELAGEIVGRALGLRLVLSFSSVALALLLLPLLDPSPRLALLVVLSLVSFPFSFYSLYLVLYSVELRMGRPRLVFGIWSLLLSLVKLGLIAADAPLEAFVLMEPVSAVVVYVLARRLGRRSGLVVRLQVDRDGWRSLLRESWAVAAAGTFIQVYLRIDHVMLYRMVGAGEVGLYGATTRLIEFANVFPTIFMASAFPLLARFQVESADRLRMATRLSFRAMAWTGIPSALFLSWYGPQVLVLLFGEPFAEAGTMIRLLAWTVPFSFCNSVLYNRLFSSGHQVVAARMAAAAAALNVGLNVPLILRWQGEGSAIATLVAYAVVLPAGLLSIHAREPASDALRSFVRPLLAGLGTGALLFWLRPGMVLGGLILATVYPALLVATGELGRDELHLLRHVTGRRAPAATVGSQADGPG